MPPAPHPPGNSAFHSVPGLVREFGDASFHTDGDINALAFTDEEELRSIEDRGVLRHWSASGRILFQTQLSEFEALWTFAPGGRLLVSGGDELGFWDGDSG